LIRTQRRRDAEAQRKKAIFFDAAMKPGTVVFILVLIALGVGFALLVLSDCSCGGAGYRQD